MTTVPITERAVPDVPAEDAPTGRPFAGGRLPLGELLVQRGLLTREQLSTALADKTEHPNRRLGEIIADRGWLTGQAIAEMLAEQHGFEFVELLAIEIPETVAELLPSELARRYEALPFKLLDDNTVLVAVADPTHVINSDNIRLALGMNVRFAVAEFADLRRAIDRIHRRDIEIDDGGPEVEIDSDSDLEDISDDATASAPAIRLVNSILGRAIEDGASDVHFEPQQKQLLVRARIDGVARTMAVIPRAMQAAVTSRLKVMGELDIAERRMPQDGRVSIRFGGVPTDMRMAVLPTTYGEQIVLRLFQHKEGALTLSDLGMGAAAEAAFVRAIQQPYGAVITCGPTGSGKTTTLYAALELLKDESRVLMTIEDPVEYQIPAVNQVEVNTKSGLTFARGLRTILRSDPDILLVGEVRDDETAKIAIQAAMTGHLVLTTLHTQDASSSIARLRDMGVDAQLLATCVNCIVAQRLARRLCVDCREAYQPAEDERTDLGLRRHDDEVVLYRAAGCPRCAGSGYRGRVALYEVMVLDRPLRRLIEAGGSTDELFAAATEGGMTTLRQDGLRLCLAGISSPEEIRRVAGDLVS